MRIWNADLAVETKKDNSRLRYFRATASILFAAIKVIKQPRPADDVARVEL
jgi:hypothetical protein